MSPFPYRLVATDLDGTLLRADESVSGRTRDALAAVTAAGAAHIVVTGRAVPWTRHILDDLGYEGHRGVVRVRATGVRVCGTPVRCGSGRRRRSRRAR
ncbi:hypothetical protein STANM309S_03443 [Streptomyces tanashiensis]